MALSGRLVIPQQITAHPDGDAQNDAVLFHNPAKDQPGRPLHMGDAGDDVQTIQVQLNCISRNFPRIPKLNPISDIFTAAMADCLRVFQEISGLPVTGAADNNTRQEICRCCRGITSSSIFCGDAAAYPGSVLSQGSQGEAVLHIQKYLTFISTVYSQIPRVATSGLYGPQTQKSILQFQERFGLLADGLVGPVTWKALANTYRILSAGAQKQPGQYPGYEMGEV